MDHAAKLDLASLEDPEFHDKLERARLQATDRSAMFSAIGQFLQALVMLIVMAAAMAAYSTWLLAVLVFCALPAFTGESRFMLNFYALSRRLTPLRRELDYLRIPQQQPGERQRGSHVRPRGLSEGPVQRAIRRSVIAHTQGHARHRMMWASILGMVASAGYYTCYVSLVVEAWEGRITGRNASTFLAGAVAAAKMRNCRCIFIAVLARFRAGTVPHGSGGHFWTEKR